MVSCDQRGGLPSLSPACPAFCFDFAPYPPSPRSQSALPRWGRGSPKDYFAGGFAPGTPALNRLRHLLALPLWYPAGGVPPALPARRALAVPCGACLSPRLPTPPLVYFPAPYPPDPPSPVGKGEILGYFMQGASPLASPGAEPERRLLTLPLWYPTGACPGVAGAASVGGTLRGLACLVACLLSL